MCVPESQYDARVCAWVRLGAYVCGMAFFLRTLDSGHGGCIHPPKHIGCACSYYYASHDSSVDNINACESMQIVLAMQMRTPFFIVII
jgi:hypothetical protein